MSDGKSPDDFISEDDYLRAKQRERTRTAEVEGLPNMLPDEVAYSLLGAIALVVVILLCCLIYKKKFQGQPPHHAGPAIHWQEVASSSESVKSDPAMDSDLANPGAASSSQAPTAESLQVDVSAMKLKVPSATSMGGSSLSSAASSSSAASRAEEARPSPGLRKRNPAPDSEEEEAGGDNEPRDV